MGFMKKLIIGTLVLAAFSAAAVSLRLHSQIDPTLGPSATAGGDSYLPVVSPDGRFVLFASTADNLAPATNGQPYRAAPLPWYNVYLRDRASNTVVLVSVGADGTSLADQDVTPTGISTNGQFALFETTADNVTPGANSGVSTVYLRDVINGTTTLVSANTNDLQANDDSYDSVMTPDGRWVAFTSDASDVVPGDTNGIPDVFVCNVPAGTTVLASPGAMAATAWGDNRSDDAAITSDGHYVAFYSFATNLVPGQTLPGDVFRRDLVAGITTWASSQARNQYQAVTGSSKAVACDPCISDDGNYLAFLVSSNESYLSANAGVVLRYDCRQGETDVIGTNANVPGTTFEGIENLAMTPDGRFVVYLANIGKPTGTNTAVYSWDAASNTNTLVSADFNNAVPAAEQCYSLRVSTNGQYVAFQSTGILTTNAIGTDWHVYRRDLAGARTMLVDVDTNGTDSDDSSSLDVCLSADGRWVIFDSTLASLTTNDFNNAYDVFARDVDAGVTGLVSARSPSMPSLTGAGLSTITAEPLSQDGHYLAFYSSAPHLVAGDMGAPPAIFVRDLYHGTTVLASVGMNGGGAQAASYNPAISGNGRFVAFTSSATNLAAAGANFMANIFVRDLQADTNSLESVNVTGTGGGNGNSDSASISYDGRFVLFQSAANNLATASYSSGSVNFFLRDRQAGVTKALTTTGGAAAAMTPDGHYVVYASTVTSGSAKVYVWDSLLARRVITNTATAPIQSVAISPDGNRLAYVTSANSQALYVFDHAANTNWIALSQFIDSEAGLRFSADGTFLVVAAKPIRAGTNQVYLCNLPARTTTLVSHAAGSSAGADGSSDSPDISADGRYVVYRSAADNIVPGDTNGVPDVFLYDATTSSNVILSASIYGAVTGNDRSESPFFSGDGHSLVFTSWASDLVAVDFNQASDVFGYSLLYAQVNAGAGGVLTVDWPAGPGQTFSVQYKNSLDDPLWQVFTGAVGTNGNRAYISDSTAGATARFYRIIADKP
jgi:Tol biopolymer transport system component